MEMISPNWEALGMFAAAVVFSLAIARGLPLLWRRNVEIAPRDLRSDLTRMDLQQLLAKANVTGNANIRDGVVLEAPSPDALHPAARLLREAVVRFYEQSPNRNAQTVYWYDPVAGEHRLFGEVDVDIISDAVMLLETGGFDS